MELPREGQRFVFTSGPPAARLPATVKVGRNKYDFEGFLHKTKTVAFLVIRNDSILYEKYLHGYDDSSIVPSFSMAKSFVSMLVGAAIADGAIKDVHEPITKYLPELADKGFDKVSIENLLDMQSGIRFREGYVNPFSEVAKFYYGLNLTKYVARLKMAGAPGEKFEYKSGNTQLLGMIVERAVHKPLADYMEEKIWSHIGAEYDASWSIDSRKDAEAKAFCCFNARARDFAKLGRLYLHHGNWNGEQLVPEWWVKQSLNCEGKNNGVYSYQWWHTRAGNCQDFFADGLLGQYVYVYPEKNIIIVRLGKKEGKAAWPYLMREIAKAN